MRSEPAPPHGAFRQRRSTYDAQVCICEGIRPVHASAPPSQRQSQTWAVLRAQKGGCPDPPPRLP